jgi:hypothetical protein
MAHHAGKGYPHCYMSYAVDVVFDLAQGLLCKNGAADTVWIEIALLVG